MSRLHERQHSSKTSRPLLASKVDMFFTREGSKAETYLSYADIELLNSVKMMILLYLIYFRQYHSCGGLLENAYFLSIF